MPRYKAEHRYSEAAERVLARAEARARLAARDRRGPPPSAELTPAQVRVQQALEARVAVVREVVARRAFPLACLGDRPLTPESLAEAEAAGLDRLELFRELALLDAEATELMTRATEMDPLTGVWPRPCGREGCGCNHRELETWLAELPTFVAAKGSVG
jgi:hypothetical protein